MLKWNLSIPLSKEAETHLSVKASPESNIYDLFPYKVIHNIKLKRVWKVHVMPFINLRLVFYEVTYVVEILEANFGVIFGSDIDEIG